MAAEAGEVEVWESIADHGCRSSVGVIVKTSNYCAFLTRAAHLANRSKVIARVKVRRSSAHLSLRKDEVGGSVVRSAEFAFVHPAPDKFARGCGPPVLRFLDDLHHPAKTVV